MSRRGTAEEKSTNSDPICHNRLVNMLVNCILKHKKKSLAYQIIYQAMKKMQQKTETNPLFVIRQAIRGVTPDIVVKEIKTVLKNLGYIFLIHPFIIF